MIENMATAQNNDFRGFAWGNTLNTVKTEEKATFVQKEKDDLLKYQDKLASADCDLIYVFNDNDKLVSGIYYFTKKHNNPQLYLQDYNKFKMLLSQKYGQPNVDRRIESGDAQKETAPQELAEGKLSLVSTWTNDRSNIKLSLVEINQVPMLQIHYTANKLSELENPADLKEALLKL